ncbi:MAG: hypothetical protein ACI395_04935 [Candidatus Cryptobacteroides sp.]
MKRTDEIEKLTAEELESLALSQAPDAPEELGREIEDLLIASSVRKKVRKPIPFASVAAGVAVAASLSAAGVFLMRGNHPADTFDDPAQAYAEVERTFAYISEKMSPGLNLAVEGKTIFDNTTEILRHK